MKSIVAFTLAMAMAGAAAAETIGFTFNAGPVFFVESEVPPGNTENLLEFEVGEDVIVEFTFDSTVEGLLEGPGDSSIDYFDPDGQIILRGALSGAEVFLDDGVRVEISGFNEFDLSSFPSEELGLGDLVLIDDIDFRTDENFLTNPFSLTQSFQELDAILDETGSTLLNRSNESTAVVAFFVPFDGGFIVDALEFGPAATAIPLPAGLPLMISALGIFAYLRQRA